MKARVRHTIRSKLVLFTVLPVLAVYSALFWAGVSHVREHLSLDAQRWLEVGARHQASRLALALTQVPVLAESIGDLIAAEPEQSQTLLYAHLIDGLRRTPIAQTAAMVYGTPRRDALMRRGAAGGERVPDDQVAEARRRGWQVRGDMLRFTRPILDGGRRLGDTWVELAIADVYSALSQQGDDAIMLFLTTDDGSVLQPPDRSAHAANLAMLMPRDMPLDTIVPANAAADGTDYWLVSTMLPQLPLRVTAVTPTDAALAPARRQASWLAAMLLLSLFAIVVIIGIVARRITRPLEDLDRSVQQIATGDFSVSPEVAGHDELARLARAIQRMARHIAERESQLHVAREILEQRVAERTEALQRSNAFLVEQIEETRKTEEALRRANEQAQQANKAKTEFLSNMSHELRTPLHGVLGYTQILRRDPAISTGQQESLAAIERCGQHLLNLINEILDLSKIEAGKMRIDLQAVDLLQLLEDVRMIVAQRAEQKGLRLRTHLAPDLPQTVVIDPVKLRQILLNLLGNAVKFTRRGEVSLTVTDHEGQLLRFEVADTGVGIPPDKVDAIFDAFQQVRNGQTVDGTGLGLAINQRLINLLGGELLQVDSTPEHGSRFRFGLPYRHAAAGELPTMIGQGQAGPHLAAARSADQPCAVMVVDGQLENREMVSTLLRYAHCDVETFAYPPDAAQRLREKSFDLILVDVRLPGTTAAEVAAALRQAGTQHPPRLVAMSGHAFTGAEQAAHAAGFDDFLAKPFSDDQLLALLDRQTTARAEPPATTAPATPWPAKLAAATAARIRAAIDLGDIASLLQLTEELAADPTAPASDVDNMALMARLFDFDGLRRLSDRLAAGDGKRRLPA